MFDYFKAKKLEAQSKAIIWSKISAAVISLPDLVTLADKAKDMNINEVQQLIASEFVSYMKRNETNDSKDE